MDSIEKLLKTGRPAKPPEHNFQIIFEGSEPKLTDYKVLASKFGGKCVKLGGGGSTINPCTEFTKMPDDMKDKLTAEAIKIIEKREEVSNL